MEVFEKEFLARKIAAFVRVNEDVAKKAAMDATWEESEAAKRASIRTKGAAVGAKDFAEILGLDIERAMDSLTDDELCEMTVELNKLGKKQIKEKMGGLKSSLGVMGLGKFLGLDEDLEEE